MSDFKPNSFWLVVYECRNSVVQISSDGKGFFACGQEELWPFDCVTEWIEEISDYRWEWQKEWKAKRPSLYKPTETK